MTAEDAIDIANYAEYARRSVTTGETAVDWVAKKYTQGDRGQALSLIFEARRLVREKGTPCPTCGHLR